MDGFKNKVGMFFLVVIILLFCIGGYFLMDYMVNLEDEDTTITNNTTTDVRIDSTKDYIYFENTEEIVNEIYYEDVVLNFQGMEDLNEELHDELVSLNEDNYIEDDDVCLINYREYTYTKFGKYISIVIVDYEYDCSLGATPTSIKSYVLDKNTGVVYTDEELLELFNISDDLIETSVKNRLNNTQVLDEDEDEVIDIESTIDNLNSKDYNTTKALSISKNGNLVINFIVISDKINYNDSVELESEE